MAVENAVALPRLIAGRVKDLPGKGDRINAGESNNADAALLRHDGGGDRSDGFGLVNGRRDAQDGFRSRFLGAFVKLPGVPGGPLSIVIG